MPEVIETQPIVPDDNQPKKSGGFREFGSFVAILLIAIGLAFLLITFVFRSYAVDGESMETTLDNQDKLIVWKVPRTVARITGHDYIPKRGDVVIFTQSDLAPCGQEGSRDLVKRVIGLPGDHVTISNGHYEIFNQDNPDGFNPDAILPYDADHHIPQTAGSTDVTLGQYQIFVSGDNRPHSCDSRAFGPIGANQLVGKLVLRLLPANEIKVF